MAAETRRGATESQKRWRERRETSPERTKVWIEPKPTSKVSVVYYLSRNGQLEHPHFMEVPLTSPDGLFLKDVINRLNSLRGKSMATMYSWSSKRSYRNGFVWHDLSDNDFIHPAHGHEYVLKGSELQISDPVTYDPRVLDSASSRSLKPPPEIHNRDFPAVTRRRNQSWSSIDLNEYKVYKPDSVGDSAGKSAYPHGGGVGVVAAVAADASTQTEEKRSRRRPAKAREEKAEEKEEAVACGGEAASTELSRGEISPPPSDSSPETLESLMKADGRLVIRAGGGENEEGANRTAESCPSGRGRASTVLMQLLSCGSVSFKNCGPSLVKDHGLTLIGQYGGKARLTRGGEIQAGVKLEEKEYFSGSLVETKKEELPPALQRSTSYNADRSSRLESTEEELGVRTKCIPRKPKGILGAKKESNIITSCDNNSHGGSKRHEQVNI